MRIYVKLKDNFGLTMGPTDEQQKCMKISQALGLCGWSIESVQREKSTAHSIDVNKIYIVKIMVLNIDKLSDFLKELKRRLQPHGNTYTIIAYKEEGGIW